MSLVRYISQLRTITTDHPTMATCGDKKDAVYRYLVRMPIQSCRLLMAYDQSYSETGVICHDVVIRHDKLRLCFLQMIIDSRGTDMESVQRSLQEGLNDVSKWSDHNGIVVHPGKTNCMVSAFRGKHQLKPLLLNLTLGTKITEQVHSKHRVLGITADEELYGSPTLITSVSR